MPTHLYSGVSISFSFYKPNLNGPKYILTKRMKGQAFFPIISLENSYPANSQVVLTNRSKHMFIAILD